MRLASLDLSFYDKKAKITEQLKAFLESIYKKGRPSTWQTFFYAEKI